MNRITKIKTNLGKQEEKGTKNKKPSQKLMKD